MASNERRVLICGDRNWNDSMLILSCITAALKRQKIDVVIEGAANGADKLGRNMAEACAIPVLRFPAKWQELGRRAGPIRNQQMLDEGKPTEVWAFHADFGNSKGTKDMVNRSVAAGLKVWLITGHEFINMNEVLTTEQSTGKLPLGK